MGCAKVRKTENLRSEKKLKIRGPIARKSKHSGDRGSCLEKTRKRKKV